jgi:hypothetical protein
VKARGAGAPDAERGRRDQAVEGLLVPRGGAQPILDPLRAAAHHLGAGGPIMAGGGSSMSPSGPRRCRRRRRPPCNRLAPGGEAFRPRRPGSPIRRCRRGRGGEAAGVRIVADRVIGPGDALLELGARVGAELVLALVKMASASNGRLSLISGWTSGSSAAAAGSSLVAWARPRRGWLPCPDQALRLRQRRKLGRAPGRSEPGELLRLGHFGRLGEQRQQLRQLDPGRALGEVELGAGGLVERSPSGKSGEPGRGARPVVGADRCEDLAIGAALLGAQLRRNGWAGLGDRRRGRKRQRSGQQEGGAFHVFTSSISIWRSAQASALSRGDSSNCREQWLPEL